MSIHPIVEITIFRTRPDLDEAVFLAADAAFNEALKAMGGFIRRELLKGDAHQWVDIIHWNSLESAQHSANTIATHPSAQTFIQMLDSSENTMLHLTPIHSYQ